MKKERIKINISKDKFIEKYNLDQSVIEENNINWIILEDIYQDFILYMEKFGIYSNLIAELLRKQEKVHTVRSRVKDPEHLIAKLIRKTPERKKEQGPEFEFTVDNYKQEITDLIGIRAIHIFKEDWENIHHFIVGNWNVKESQANIREGDNKEQYTSLNVEINSRKTGYRSVHYLIELMPTNEKITAEIQVRTIFEEGYGEIDHQLSYPNNNVPDVLQLNLLMLNRLAGSSDEMASAVRTIKKEWSNLQSSLVKKNSELEKLREKIEKLNIHDEEKESLVQDIGKIKVGSSEILSSNLNSFKLSGAVIDAMKMSQFDATVMNAIKIPNIYSDAMNAIKTPNIYSKAMNAVKLPTTINRIKDARLSSNKGSL